LTQAIECIAYDGLETSH